MARRLLLISIAALAVACVGFLMLVAAGMVWTASVWATQMGPLKGVGVSPWIPAGLAVVNAIGWPLIMYGKRRAGF